MRRFSFETRNRLKYFNITIKIWSAACSTGQEIYSLAIILKELLKDLNKYNLRLLGTDISDEAVARASYGRYNKFEIERGLDKSKLMMYFNQNSNYWKIRDDIRAMVMFKKMNLMEPFAGLGKFDIIFCRNVAIYFNLEDRKRLFERIAGVMEPDGYRINGVAYRNMHPVRTPATFTIGFLSAQVIFLGLLRYSINRNSRVVAVSSS